MVRSKSSSKAGKSSSAAKPKPSAKAKVAARPASPKRSEEKGRGSKERSMPKPPKVPSAPPPVEASAPLPVPLSDEPSRILSLQFVRDGDEFLARLETAGGHITELKNRSLDQLLTMVAGELEDLLG